MSKQTLYETEQCFTYKGKKLHIRFDEKYFDLIPRPINEEKKLLKEDIQKNGLHESIKINLEGVVLDGHTRIEICEECGWKKLNEEPIIARYEVKEFKTKQEERDYVIKTNLIRRQLNTFQKVRLVFKLYNDNIHSKRERTRYDILLELKKHGEPVKSSVLGQELGQHKANVLKLLRGLKEDYCVNYEVREEGFNKKEVHYYYILPKGEEILFKGRPEKIILQTLGKSVGVGRENTSRAIFLMNHAPPYMLARLEHGEIGVMKAYTDLTKSDKPKRTINKKYLKGYNKVICPHCNQVSMKKDWEIYNGTD